jgi:hypothetical protein
MTGQRPESLMEWQKVNPMKENDGPRHFRDEGSPD